MTCLVHMSVYKFLPSKILINENIPLPEYHLQWHVAHQGYMLSFTSMVVTRLTHVMKYTTCMLPSLLIGIQF